MTKNYPLTFFPTIIPYPYARHFRRLPPIVTFSRVNDVRLP